MSEVIRGGYVKVLFAIGCTVGFIPTIVFATNYLKVALNYSKQLTSSCGRFMFRNLQYVPPFVCRNA